MKHILVTSILGSLCLAFSQLAQAHPGHDHGHWSSEPIHILTIVAVAAVIITGLVYKQVARRSKKRQQEERHHDA